MLSFHWFRSPFSAWRRNISLMSGTFISGFDRFFFFLWNGGDFCVRTGEQYKWLPRKNQGFLICRFRVIIFYQLFESIQNHAVFYRCRHFYSNFARYFQTSLNQRWTTKIGRCECCSYLCTLINTNLETSLGKCPTVRKNKNLFLISIICLPLLKIKGKRKNKRFQVKL